MVMEYFKQFCRPLATGALLLAFPSYAHGEDWLDKIGKIERRARVAIAERVQEAQKPHTIRPHATVVPDTRYRGRGNIILHGRDGDRAVQYGRSLEHLQRTIEQRRALKAYGRKPGY